MNYNKILNLTAKWNKSSKKNNIVCFLLQYESNISMCVS